MSSFSERDPRVVAVVGIAVLAVLVTAVLNIGRLPLVGDGDRYTAVFADAAGLHEGESVTIAGVPVGTVDSVELVGDRVEVAFFVKEATLPDATRASIEIKTLLGSHYLALSPAGHGELAPGSRIPLERTTTPLNVVPAFQETTRRLDRIDTERLGIAMRAVADVLRDTAPEVRGTLKGLSALSMTLSSRDADLKQLFRRARGVTETLAARDTEVTELLRDANVVLAVLHQRRDTIRHILRDTTTLATELSGLVRDNARRLGPALTKLNQVLAVLKANDKQLNEAITQVTVYARTFANAVGTGQWFDAVLAFPRGFAACSNPEGNPLATLLDPLLSETNRRVSGGDKPCLPLGPATDTSGGR